MFLQQIRIKDYVCLNVLAREECSSIAHAIFTNEGSKKFASKGIFVLGVADYRYSYVLLQNKQNSKMTYVRKDVWPPFARKFFKTSNSAVKNQAVLTLTLRSRME